MLIPLTVTPIFRVPQAGTVGVSFDSWRFSCYSFPGWGAPQHSRPPRIARLDFAHGLVSSFLVSPVTVPASPFLLVPPAHRHHVPLPEVELKYGTPWLRTTCLAFNGGRAHHRFHPAESPISSTTSLPKQAHRLSHLAQAAALLPESPPTVPPTGPACRPHPGSSPPALRPPSSPASPTPCCEVMARSSEPPSNLLFVEPWGPETPTGYPSPLRALFCTPAPPPQDPP